MTQPISGKRKNSLLAKKKSLVGLAPGFKSNGIAISSCLCVQFTNIYIALKFESFFAINVLHKCAMHVPYRQIFEQVQLGFGGQVLSSCQFSLLSQLPQNMRVTSKVVKIYSKIIISPYQPKSMTHPAVTSKIVL